MKKIIPKLLLIASLAFSYACEKEEIIPQGQGNAKIVSDYLVSSGVKKDMGSWTEYQMPSNANIPSTNYANQELQPDAKMTLGYDDKITLFTKDHSLIFEDRNLDGKITSDECIVGNKNQGNALYQSIADFCK
jgi:hypothetical protein